jgi:hypothetical protein
VACSLLPLGLIGAFYQMVSHGLICTATTLCSEIQLDLECALLKEFRLCGNSCYTAALFIHTPGQQDLSLFLVGAHSPLHIEANGERNYLVFKFH